MMLIKVANSFLYYISKFDNIICINFKPSDSSKLVDHVCGHYIWSDYNKNCC